MKRLRRVGLWTLLIAAVASIPATLSFSQDIAGGKAFETGVSWVYKARQYFQGGTDITQMKCINIDPTNAVTDWLFWRTPAALTVTHIRCIVDVATNVPMTLRKCDATTAASCTNIEAAITCATTTTSEASSIDDAAVTVNQWLRVTRGTLSGSPTQVIVCMEYTVP